MHHLSTCVWLTYLAKTDVTSLVTKENERVNITQAMQFIKLMFYRQIDTGERFTIELVSAPGMGKSEMVPQTAEQIAKERNIEEFGCDGVFLNSKESVDMGGFGLPDTDPDDGSKIMTYTKAFWVPRSSSPEYGILFLDEFQQSPHDVQKPSAELLLNGRVNESELPITWMVVAASNREQDRSGVQRELMFVTNRRCLIKITPHLGSWVDWAETVGNVHWAAIAFAKHKPGLVFKDAVPDHGGPFCTPRSFVKMSRLIDYLPQELFIEAAAGYVGEGTAAEFVSFLRVVDELPTFEEIVANPDTCKLPSREKPDAQYAAMQMIAHRVDGDTAAPAFNYLKRLPQEFQVAGLRSTLNRQPTVLQNPDFAKWVRDNKKLVVNANLISSV